MKSVVKRRVKVEGEGCSGRGGEMMERQVMSRVPSGRQAEEADLVYGCRA